MLPDYEASPHKPAALDRTAAIVSASYLEYALQHAIVRKLGLDLDKKETKALFDGERPVIAGLYSKIILANALDIIEGRTAEDLHTIRVIRNNFSHSLRHLEFKDEPVAALCSTLDVDEIISPQKRFILCVASNFRTLMMGGYKPRKVQLLAEALAQPSPDKSK